MKKKVATIKALKAGVIGVGSLGQHHARVYTQLPGITLAGVVDTKLSQANLIAKRNRCQVFRSVRELISEVDLVSIVVPTAYHFVAAKECLLAGIPVLLEKPMTRNLKEADELIRIAHENKTLLQVGHIERFNEAVQALKEILVSPRFIEAHRLGPFSQRNTDIGVVLDLMIHDLDIILGIVKSEVKKIEAVGVKVLSGHEDIANARLIMSNGCVANVTASRVSGKAKRKIRIFSTDSYISIDYKKQELRIYRLRKDVPRDEKNLMSMIKRERKTFGKKEPLVAELSSFVEAVRGKHKPEVTGEDGRQALAVAITIRDQIKAQNYFA